MIGTIAVTEMQFVGAAEIMACVGVGRTKAYAIIQQLNAELEKEGYLTFPGKVPTRKFQERLYLGTPKQEEKPVRRPKAAKTK